VCNVGVVRTELDLMCDVGVGCGRIFDASTWCVLPTSVVKNTHHSFDSLLSVYHFFLQHFSQGMELYCLPERCAIMMGDKACP